MLCLSISVGESILAKNLFELHLVEFVDESLMQFRMEVLDRQSYLFIRESGALRCDAAYPEEPGEFATDFGGRIRIAGCVLHLERFGRQSVKVAIEAPRDIVFSRPAAHGTSLGAR